MCGRTACTLAPDEFPKACRYRGRDGKLQDPQWRNGSSGEYFPSYNIAPHSYTPVLLSAKHAESQVKIEPAEGAASAWMLQSMRWGLLPSWYHGEPSQFSFNMSNARYNTLLDKRSFKVPLQQGKRCVVLAEGFYEWQSRKSGTKQPYYIQFKTDRPGVKTECDGETVETMSLGEGGRLLTMAGLFDCCRPANTGKSYDNEEMLYSYTIITVDASSEINWLHHRMPAILNGDEEIKQWLDFGEVSYLKALGVISPKNCLQWHPVSTVVNNARNKTADCIKRIQVNLSERKTTGTLLSYFKPLPKKKGEELQEPSSKKAKLQ